MTKKTREQTRNERAEKVCRELRYQMANTWTNSRLKDDQRLYELLTAWMQVSKKIKFIRP